MALRQELSPLERERTALLGLSFNLQELRILVVADDTSARDLLTMALAESGCRYRKSRRDLKALEILMSSASSDAMRSLAFRTLISYAAPPIAERTLRSSEYVSACVRVPAIIDRVGGKPLLVCARRPSMQ
jgi:hypothetical protein